MEIKNLLSFLHVAEMGSFTKAAQLFGYSQAAISFQESDTDAFLKIFLQKKHWRLIRFWK